MPLPLSPPNATQQITPLPLSSSQPLNAVQQFQQVMPLPLSPPNATQQVQQVTPLPLSSPQQPNAAQQVTPLPLCSSQPPNTAYLQHPQSQPSNNQQQAHCSYSVISCNFMQQYQLPPPPQCSSNDSIFLMHDEVLSIISDQVGIPIERTPESYHELDYLIIYLNLFFSYLVCN